MDRGDSVHQRAWHFYLLLMRWLLSKVTKLAQFLLGSGGLEPRKLWLLAAKLIAVAGVASALMATLLCLDFYLLKQGVIVPMEDFIVKPNRRSNA